MKIAAILFLGGFFLSLFTHKIDAAEGSFDVFGAETLFQSGTQWYYTQKFKPSTKLVDGSKRVSNTSKNKKIDLRGTLGVNFSPIKHWQFGVFFPFVHRSYRFNDIEGDVTGLTDITVYGKHMFIKENWPRGAWQASAILGFDLPTGKHGEQKNGVRLPESLQLGSGAINSIFGVSTGWEWHKFGISFLGIHTVKPTGAHHFNPGNSTQIGFTMKYRFYQKPFPGPGGNFRWGVTYEHKEQSKKRGNRVSNSGGHSWEGKIGWVHHPTPPTDLTFFYRFPLAHRLHGTQLVTDHSLEIAAGLRF